VVWIGIGVDQVTRDCDVQCGDRDRSWFLLILVTAPLIPLGLALVARRAVPAGLLRVGRFACVLACGGFALLGLVLLAVAIGAFVDLVEGNYGVNLDDPADSRRQAIIEVVIWVLAAVWCFGVALGTLAARRRLRRRYPSTQWPPSDRSTSAG
jgi:hypothetical protein